MKVIHMQITRVMFLSVIAAGLASCGGSGQDEGSPSNFEQPYSGRVIDGYLARSTVFVDANNNGTRDAWEAWAFTDNDGYYSFNQRTGVDYCRDDAPPEEAQYCLVTNVEYSNVVIRIDSGYDVITGEPFLGQMSRRVNAIEEGEVTNSVVSPITSLLSNVDAEEDRAALLTSLSITEEQLDVDYLNNQGVVDAPLLNTALKIHKVVAVLSDRLTDTYTEIGENFGTPNDATSAVYPNLAQQIIASNEPLDTALANENTLVSALDAAEASLREVYERKDFELPADMGNADNPGAFQRVVDVATDFSSVVNTLIDVNADNFTLEEATGSTRALEALVIKTVGETQTDTSIDNVINFFDVQQADDVDQANELVDALVTSLSSDAADISSLVTNDFNSSDFDSVEEISEAASLGDDVTPFTVIGGKQVRVSELQLGEVGDLEDKEVEFYFDGQPGDVEGTFSACVKYIDDATEDGSLGEGNTRGEILSGFWSLLGATEGNVSSFSLLITLTFLETTYQAIMKPAGMESVIPPTVPGSAAGSEAEDYHRIRFDFDGELNIWHSKKGFVDIVNTPTTNADCEGLLRSRLQPYI